MLRKSTIPEPAISPAELKNSRRPIETGLYYLMIAAVPEQISASDQYDVAVIGGGPAGSTVSTFLAQQGRRVALIEKSQHPRFHIGESLLPKNLPIIDRLGLKQEIAEIGVKPILQ